MRVTDVYSQLGGAIKRRRETLGLTQAAVAPRVGLTRASLANIETGRQKVLLHHVYLLADALDLKSILDLVPAAIEPTVEGEPMKLNTNKVTTTQKAQVASVLRQALEPAAPGRRR